MDAATLFVLACGAICAISATLLLFVYELVDWVLRSTLHSVVECGVWCAAAAAVLLILHKLYDWLRKTPRIDPTGRHVLVTGCDTGFGKLAAIRLDAAGCHVFATCITDDGESQLKSRCSSRLRTVRMDVSNADSVRSALKFVKNELPPGKGLHGVVNNAGIAGKVFGPLEWLTMQNYKDVFAVNLYGLIDVTMTFLPLIKLAKGRVVNVASVHGRTCLHGNVPYSCSKYGVEAFSDGLRRQMYGYGCSVHIIEPGFHRTNIVNRTDTERLLRQAWDQATPAVKEEYGEEFLEKSVGAYLDKFIPRIASERVDDVVDAFEDALFSCRPRSRYVVGLDAHLVWLPLQWLPEWLGDWLMYMLDIDAPVPAVLRKK